MWCHSSFRSNTIQPSNQNARHISNFSLKKKKKTKERDIPLLLVRKPKDLGSLSMYVSLFVLFPNSLYYTWKQTWREFPLTGFAFIYFIAEGKLMRFTWHVHIRQKNTKSPFCYVDKLNKTILALVTWRSIIPIKRSLDSKYK